MGNNNGVILPRPRNYQAQSRGAQLPLPSPTSNASRRKNSNSAAVMHVYTRIPRIQFFASSGRSLGRLPRDAGFGNRGGAAQNREFIIVCTRSRGSASRLSRLSNFCAAESFSRFPPPAAPSQLARTRELFMREPPPFRARLAGLPRTALFARIGWSRCLEGLPSGDSRSRVWIGSCWPSGWLSDRTMRFCIRRARPPRRQYLSARLRQIRFDSRGDGLSPKSKELLSKFGWKF